MIHSRNAAAATLLALGLTSAGVGGEAAGPNGLIEEGHPFPDLVLPTLDGTPGSIGMFRGRKVLLEVFASW